MRKVYHKFMIKSSIRSFFILIFVVIICLIIFKSPLNHSYNIVISQINNSDLQITNYIVTSKLSISDLRNLPDLTKLNWPGPFVAKSPSGRKYPNGTKFPLPVAFEPVYSIGQRKVVVRLLETFSKLMFDNGLGDQFMLYGGTLLGSFRHHDFIPWDDDLDLIINSKFRPQVQALIDQLGPEYVLKKQKGRDKFYTRLPNDSNAEEDFEMSRKSSDFSWGWPYLDLAYYDENETHIFEIEKSYGRFYSWPKSIIFPLYFRPFGKHWYPSPRDPLSFISFTYSPSSDCTHSGYSHMYEGPGTYGVISCKDLRFQYPFVEHKACTHPFLQISTEADPNKMVWGEENLVIISNTSERILIHSICLPVPQHNCEAETYGYNYKSIYKSYMMNFLSVIKIVSI